VFSKIGKVMEIKIPRKDKGYIIQRFILLFFFKDLGRGFAFIKFTSENETKAVYF
jgi:RNA recognition motif-containing protein